MKRKALIVATAIAFTTGIAVPAYASISYPASTIPDRLNEEVTVDNNPFACAQPTEPNCGSANGAGGWLPDRPAPIVHYKYYTVHKGDTLWRIAVRSYGNTPHAGQQYRKIMKLNHLRTTRIHPGQVLRIN